jgi:PAS domain S-box-containing protein
MADEKSLWELLWDYDPNGLVVIDEKLILRIANPSFCRMFRTTPEAIIGQPASQLFTDLSDFQRVWETNEILRTEKEYSEHELYVREIIFAIRTKGITACIMVDLTKEWEQRKHRTQLEKSALERVHAVVDNQMKVAQEIAGLLGEATATTKVGLLELMEMLERGDGSDR